MTRRGGKEVSERRTEIGEDEGQPEMALLAAWCQFGNIDNA